MAQCPLNHTGRVRAPVEGEANSIFGESRLPACWFIRRVDLLSDRQFNTVSEWLREHAPPAVISQDRAWAYARAARLDAPQTVQVADRFHLLRNLREALEHVSARHTTVIEETFPAISSRFGCASSAPTPPHLLQHVHNSSAASGDRDDSSDTNK